jgi:hypothetical protein
VVVDGQPRGALLIQRCQEPVLYDRGGPLSFYLAKCEAAGSDNDRAQLGEAAAAAVIEVHKPKSPTRHRLLQKTDRRVARDVVLATEVIEGADQAASTVAVIIAAARPVRTVCEKLEQEIEHLNRFIYFILTHPPLLILRLNCLDGSIRPWAWRSRLEPKPFDLHGSRDGSIAFPW